MTDNAAAERATVHLHRVASGQEVLTVELSADDFTTRARCRTATADEIRSLIEELFRQLPESERQALFVRIRTDSMI